MNNSNEAVDNILTRNTHIAAASEKQSIAIFEVNQNIVNINSGSETISKKSPDTSTAANKTGELTAGMDSMTAVFQVR
ncbi:MAG: hypothetical protein V7784_18585 [Oceanospirillaceae bacterium]